MKKKMKNKTNFINGSFLLFFFSSHSVCNEVINPIWVGIVPVRLFWGSCLTWKDKKDERMNKFYESSFLSSFYSSHRYCNEVINPIWVGIVPIRLFWERSLKWSCEWIKKEGMKRKYFQIKIKPIFWIFISFFSQICQWSHQSNLSWNCSSQIVLIKLTKKKNNK